jgi:signal peptidase II
VNNKGIRFSTFAIALSVFILDQASKAAARHFLALGQSVPLIPRVFHLTLVHNTGAAFGFFKGATVLLAAISLACVAVIALWFGDHRFFKKVLPFEETDRASLFSLGLVLGGACGNLLDRLVFSYVIDFIDWRVWPVFNVADSAITVGGVLLFFRLMKAERRESSSKPL